MIENYMVLADPDDDPREERDIFCRDCGTVMSGSEREPIHNGPDDIDYACCQCGSTELDDLPYKWRKYEQVPMSEINRDMAIKSDLREIMK